MKFGFQELVSQPVAAQTATRIDRETPSSKMYAVRGRLEEALSNPFPLRRRCEGTCVFRLQGSCNEKYP